MANGKFANNEDIFTVIIPNDATLNTSAFANTPNLKYVNIENITTISFQSCFQNSGFCAPVYLPRLTGSVSGYYIFENSKIYEIKSLGTITNTGMYMFRSCTNLRTAVLPSTLTTIYYGTFDTCTNLETIEFQNGLTEIEGRAFINCEKLNTTIPQSVEIIRTNAFHNCKSLSTVLNLPNLTLLYGYNVFSNSGVTGIQSLGSITTIDGGGVTTGAFCNCKSLTSVVLPSTLTTINAGAFAYDDAITSMNLPTSITYIGSNAFRDCTSWTITDLSLPNLEELNSYAFCGPNIKKISNLGKITTIPNGGTSGGVFSMYPATWVGQLTEVRIPATVTSIGSYAFYRHANLVSVYCYATTPPSLQSTTFGYTNSTFKIYVPSASVNTYKTATNWSSFASRIYSM